MSKLVQASDGTLYSVDLDRNTCSCGQKTCEHLIIATDVYRNHGKRHRFSIMSASHKSGRTSSIEWAMPWAEVFASISGIGKVATYFSKCIFEDSRNLKLWAQIRNNELTSEQQVRGFILSRKKWENLPGFGEHLTWWTAAHSVYLHNKSSWNEAKLRRQIRKYQTPLEGYEIWFLVKEKKHFRPALWEELAVRAEREKNERLQWYLQYRPESGYEIMVGLELAINAFDESASEFHPDSPNPESYVPAFHEQYEDIHSYAGRRNFMHWFSPLLQGTLPPESKLSLQLSGQLWGCAFRHAAFNQRRTITLSPGRLIPWQDVRLEQETSSVAELDSLFYKSTYAALEKKGRWKPPVTPRATLPLSEELSIPE